jgi:carboxymethylenebutenolidase
LGPAPVLVRIGILRPNGLPIAGIATGQKLLNEILPSNGLMAKWSESEGKS